MEDKRFYHTAGFRTLLGAVLWLALYLILMRAAQLPTPMMSAAIDGLLALGALAAMLALTAQFALPVRSWSDRATAIERLWNSLFGARGPVTYIQNGVAIEAHQERKRRGPGVLLIDNASAAVLRTKSRFTRAVGPGVVFTHGGEYLAQALDLRRQARSLESEAPTPGAPAQGSALSSLALTEDGIPVTADIKVQFILDPGPDAEPRQGADPYLPPYAFNPDSAARAVYGHPFQQEQEIPWTELPVRLAADLWREFARQWPLEDLISPRMIRPTPMQQIRSAIEARLTASGIAEGAPPSREAQVLYSRGIRVLGVDLHGLHVPEEVLSERARRWEAAWSEPIRQELAEAEAARREARRRGELQAYRELAAELTAGLRTRLERSEPLPDSLRDTLLLMLQDAIQIARRGAAGTAGQSLANQLLALHEEIMTLEEDCRKR